MGLEGQEPDHDAFVASETRSQAGRQTTAVGASQVLVGDCQGAVARNYAAVECECVRVADDFAGTVRVVNSRRMV